MPKSRAVSFAVFCFLLGLLLGASIKLFIGLEWPWHALESAVDLLGKLLTWQFVALCVLVFLIFSPNLLRLLTRFRRIGFLGTEIEFSQEEAEKLSLDASQLFTDVSQKVNSAFQHCSSRLELKECFRRTMEAIRTKSGIRSWPDGFRATIHVADVVYGETLFQLLDYFPQGEGKGRRKSIRFGIIGLAFRSEEDQAQPDLANSQLGAGRGGRAAHRLILTMREFGQA